MPEPDFIFLHADVAMEKTVKLALDTVDHVPQNRSMNMRNVALVTGGLLVGGLVVLLVERLSWCEPDHVKYVVEWNEAKLENPDTTHLDAFKAALSDSNVRFRHNIVVSLSGTSNDAPELGNIGLSSSFCLDFSKPKMGLHVTQRVAFDDLDKLDAAAKLLKP